MKNLEPAEVNLWRPGTQILWVYQPPGDRPAAVQPVTVVRDDPGGLIAWLAAGTPTLETVRPDGRPRRADKSTMFTTERVQVRSVWRHHHCLRVAPAARRWSMWCCFDAVSGGFEGWYVNLEEPHRREELATITRDLVLDVVVDPDHVHRRKDEDELRQAVLQGRYSPEEADRIRHLAEEVEAVIDVWGSPFCDGWEQFVPDPTWPLPALPPGGWPGR
jgi:hypothetical protein